MDEDILYQHVIDRFSPDELCEILDISTKDFVDRFYDEIISDTRVRELLGVEGYESED